MVTAAALLASDPDEVRQVAGYYREAAASIADRSDELDVATRILRGAWSGAAQRSALAALAGVRDRLVHATVALTSADQALSEFAEALVVARRLIGTDSLGTVGRSLRMAEAADADAARRLGGTADWFGPVQAPPSVPPVGTAPWVVTQWWTGLTSAERRDLITSQSADLIAMDGVPADARDEAARLQLRIQGNALQAQRDELAAHGLLNDEIGYELTGLGEIQARLDNPDAANRAYLLNLDVADDRAIFSIGDPDQATDVVTMVSGLDSGLDNAGATMSNVSSVWDAASKSAADGQDAAAVGWLDYRAPASVQDAMSSSAADNAAGPLARFTDGLAATHSGPPAHESVLGYSYGSTVVGAAAHDRHLHVDDILLVGSPGATVDRAADLGIDPHHVWATTASGDAVRLALNPVATITESLTGQTPSQLWFGTDPTSPDFGGEVFASKPGSWLHPVRTHMAYFDDGSETVTNIAAIVDGRRPSR